MPSRAVTEYVLAWKINDQNESIEIEKLRRKDASKNFICENSITRAQA